MDSQLGLIFGAIDDTFSLKVEVNQARNEATAVARIDALPIIHERCGLALGDAIHNYRSALDHIAWNLVKVGTKPEPRKPNLVQFPMSRSRKEFEGEKLNRLPGINEDRITVIRRYQPYIRGERGTAIRRLNRLANMDKHRVLIPAVVTPAGHDISVISNWQHALPPKYFIGNRRALKVNAKVVEAKLVRAGASDCQVNVQGNLQVYPSLGRGLHVGAALLQINETILSLLQSLEETL